MFDKLHSQIALSGFEVLLSQVVHDPRKAQSIQGASLQNSDPGCSFETGILFGAQIIQQSFSQTSQNSRPEMSQKHLLSKNLKASSLKEPLKREMFNSSSTPVPLLSPYGLAHFVEIFWGGTLMIFQDSSCRTSHEACLR